MCMAMVIYDAKFKAKVIYDAKFKRSITAIHWSACNYMAFPNETRQENI